MKQKEDYIAISPFIYFNSGCPKKLFDFDYATWPRWHSGTAEIEEDLKNKRSIIARIME